ncbi:GntR family transcriptional regulator [Actinocatenispora rupis]|uniref:GntR family transcriptional regulator n=1 Tax=Actinocatenispora rupis TaxID=519421 RepID=A0A8J3J154_9ACTN|nr:GntR family transcriptional regulator [Actinocatenispora rupis]GID09601.1 GntR family transcriptional regulator [Actinocatenispora rupis]
MSPRSPLALSLAASLEREILSGHWPVGSKLPTERELAARSRVSRQVVREAFDELERAGFIIRRQGSGTYVAGRRLEQSLLGHFSIVDALRSSGATITTEVLSRTVTPALPAVAASLDIDPDASVLELERLRRADGEPLMLEQTWLPADRLPGIAAAQFSDTSLYAILREEYGVLLVRATESFEPVVLHQDEARPLEVAAGSPALMLLRTTYDDAGVPMEAARALLRADRCRTLVERRVEEPDRTPRARTAR